MRITNAGVATNGPRQRVALECCQRSASRTSRPPAGAVDGCILESVTTGWNNQQAVDKVNRTLTGESPGRLAVLLIVAAFLALGIYTGNLWLSVPFGMAAAAAAWTVVSAGRNDLAARRMQRRG
jgi:hypothetical protein